ncbi:MAG TPA: hypothetical protein VFA75_10725 [Nevskia sp.]|nr:hypothetical protein [Nevskia sp.]
MRLLPRAANYAAKPTFLRASLLWGFLLLLGFDFRKQDDTSGAAVQFALLGGVLGCGFLFIMLESISRRRVQHSSFDNGPMMIWTLYLAYTVIPVLVWGIQLDRYFKVLLPMILFGTGIAVMHHYDRRGYDPRWLINVLFWTSLISAMWTPIYAIALSGLDISQARFQIIGPGLSFLLGYGAASIFVKRNHGRATLGLVYAVMIVLLSITRSFAIGLVLIMLALMAVDAKRRNFAIAMTRGIRMVGIVLVLGTVAIGAAIAVRPNTQTMWSQRVQHQKAAGGQDITYITRLAEYYGQWKAMTATPMSFFVGKGVGSEYVWDQGILNKLDADVVDETHWWLGGHSTWIYPFYSNGAIMGLIVPFMFIYSLRSGYVSASKATDPTDFEGATILFVVLITYLGQSFTGNILSGRYTSLILGVVVGGLMIYARRRRVSVEAQRNNQSRIAATDHGEAAPATGQLSES